MSRPLYAQLIALKQVLRLTGTLIQIRGDNYKTKYVCVSARLFVRVLERERKTVYQRQ